MELYYEYDNYLKRLKTPLWQEKGRVLYYGIYDFSYKYRTRIFDVDDNEIAYVEKDITAEEPGFIQEKNCLIFIKKVMNTRLNRRAIDLKKPIMVL